MKLFVIFSLLSSSLLHSGGISLGRTKIEFTPNSKTLASVTIENIDKLNITNKGLGWDSNSSRTQQISLQSKAIASPTIHQPEIQASVSINVISDKRDPSIKKMDIYNASASGTFFVRYSANKNHWSSWIALTQNEPKAYPFDDHNHHYSQFSTTLAIPEVDRSNYLAHFAVFKKQDDVNWTNDELALAYWITQKEPDFFNKNIPYIGWIQFRYEGHIQGSKRIKTINLLTGFSVGGLSSLGDSPKNGVYPSGLLDFDKQWSFSQP